MGSLVPGWDADIGVPRDEAAVHPLGRISAPQSVAKGNTKQALVQRSSTLTHTGSRGAAAPHKYQFTDWSEELTSLRKGGSHLGRSSLGAHEHAHETGREEASAWWRALEVGQLNEHPDAVPSSATHGVQHATFMPQFTQSKQLDFGDSGSK
ncbi:hypothetical protein VOLCADRAFT_86925 [Volvox carteri f. nagariensis]|uniref:Uncharacterized protein n=1 Tax=Volvox carteri f. nagariensis TaxID=3068 RepID=D8TKQ6_VOLCA|nr:uncharacterized protein VOLCADRAFT_86925 [Volvox carteri f. nagariensis]EFJ52105.1 hypothetical protein VOLCADRAFT_86925 [Volvox carteri f. nagariensis]|eukprot:XP_002946879.1 hypothetical protein VOLCADRAFT_86925 [Volvox carteri f. nagariensis]